MRYGITKGSGIDSEGFHLTAYWLTAIDPYGQLDPLGEAFESLDDLTAWAREVLTDEQDRYEFEKTLDLYRR